jgi:putative transposase
MKLNRYGSIVENVWRSLPKHHNVKLDQFQIMPNHIHFIIIIRSTTHQSHIESGASRRAPTTIKTKPTLGMIVGFLKSESIKQIRALAKNPNFIIWQRNYYERIIRDENEYNHIRYYFKTNPQNWEEDRNNKENW